MIWGRFVSSELEKIEGDNTKKLEKDRERKLNQLLGLQVETKGQFADPALLFQNDKGI